MSNEHFECWYVELQQLAKKHGENVSDRDAWREIFDPDQSAAEAFFEEYPEHAA